METPLLPLLQKTVAQTIARIKTRTKAAWKRHQKSRLSQAWLKRWNKACKKSWTILEGTPSRTKLERFERTHTRLLKLAETKHPSKFAV
jgi:hypothetical protein